MAELDASMNRGVRRLLRTATTPTSPGSSSAARSTPRLVGRLDDRQIERAAAALFVVVGTAFALKAATG